MYFIAKQETRELYTKNNTWMSLTAALQQPDQVVVYSTHSQVCEAIQEVKPRVGVFPFTEKTMKKNFGVENAASLFGPVLKKTPQALPAAKKPPSTTEILPGTPPQAVFQTEILPSPPEPHEDPPLDDDPKVLLVPSANLDETFYTPFITETVNMLERMADLIERLETTRTERQTQLGALDRQTQDELHYIEFSRLSAPKGYKAYKRLHEIRVERRRVKNEWQVANMLQGKLNQELLVSIHQYLAAIDGLKNRCYEPRCSWPETTEKEVQRGK